MKNKKDLNKIVLTALILASTAPVTGHVDMGIEAQGILLAAGCPAHGCANASAPASNNPSPVFSQNSRDYSAQLYGRAPVGAPSSGYIDSQNAYDNAVAGTASSVTLTEAQLLGMLSPQGRAIYLNLDPEAKALAIQLASQDSYRDKNLAVKEAQRRMNERRGSNR